MRVKRSLVRRAKPAVSIVVVIYNMVREAKRTLYSLTSKYQKGVKEEDYEVIVVDNGSFEMLRENYLEDLGPNFRYFYIKEAPPSPAFAVNFGVRQTMGKYVGIMIDGARMLSPGVIKYALQAFKAFQDPIVATLGWHLGPDIQRRSVLKGYSKEVEDQMLEAIKWPEDGYRLFKVSSMAGSSGGGWFSPISESSCLFMHKARFNTLGGYDERFDSPGGGLLSLDMYKRACESPDTNLVIILGEGNFHQLHAGAATGLSEDAFQMRFQEWEKQYQDIRKRPYEAPTRDAEYIGHIPREALKFIQLSAEFAIQQFS